MTDNERPWSPGFDEKDIEQWLERAKTTQVSRGSLELLVQGIDEELYTMWMVDGPASTETEQHHRMRVATEHATTYLLICLIDDAMRTAYIGGCLGSNDSDGRGLIYHQMLDDSVEYLLGSEIIQVVPKEPTQTVKHRRANPVTSIMRGRILQRDNDTCQHCGSHDDLEIDHIIPVAAGGMSTFENLQVLCQQCNSKKGAKVDA